MMGTNELLVIALVVLVLFGASAIPKFARSLGEAKKEFDKGAKEGFEEKDKKEADKKDGTLEGGDKHANS
ncbi:MAG TPA: twin-arginine translocase TatA/TatE family subunit [Spirochaetales bacterium]|nr:twin-arginine translocase TatA/TatE family subunit [Spirochaetales bacterium]